MSSEIPSSSAPPPLPPLQKRPQTQSKTKEQPTQISLDNFDFSIEKPWVNIAENLHSFQEEIMKNQPIFGIDTSVCNLFLVFSD